MSNFIVHFSHVIILVLIIISFCLAFFFTFSFHRKFFPFFAPLVAVQSFNNLNYRPDPVIVLGEEHQHQNRSGRHNQETSVQFQSGRRYPEDGGRYKPQQRGIMSDARPYASTNLIHQIGAESTELRDRNGSDEQRRGPPLVTSGPTESAPPPPAQTAAAQSHRQMRYFGDTDLESQPSRGGGYSSRYMPKAKVLRSASSAAGMGAVRR